MKRVQQDVGRRLGWMLGLSALLAVAIGGVTVYAAGESLDRAAIVSGGGIASGGGITLRNATGQPVAGIVTNGNVQLCSGIGCGPGSISADTPISGLTASNDSPTALGSPTGFEATVATGNNVSYAWDFGDGENGSGANPTHTYVAAGTYTATVTASNGAGAAGPVQTVAIVTDALVEARGDNTFFPLNVTIDVNETVIWTRLGGDHSITADDGSFEQPPSGTWTTFSHTFTSPGVFPYHCTLHGNVGGVGMSGTVTVLGSNGNPAAIYLPLVDGP